MKWLLIVGALMFGSLLYFCAPAREPISQPPTVSIPLDRIWGFDMPGTQDIRDLEPDKFGEHAKSLPTDQQISLLHESHLGQIQAGLSKHTALAEPGFAVLGIAAEALQGAYDVLVQEKTPPHLHATNKISLVFFSHLCAQYVRLSSIQRHGNTIDIRYQFIPHRETTATVQLALLPIGFVPAGHYGVEIVQDANPGNAGIPGGLPESEARKFICQPFEFSVEE
jgi:hypothetical protein